MNKLKKISVYVIGSLFAWMCGLFTALTILEAFLTIVCLFMMGIDNGPVDHYWNCGVLIHGFEAIVCSVIAFTFWCLTYLTLKIDWWRLPAQQLKAIGRVLLYRP